MDKCCNGEVCEKEAPPRAASQAMAAAASLQLRIENMCCPAEETLIRRRLSGVEGVATLDFDLIRRRLTVRHGMADPAPILAALRSIGMDATPVEQTADCGERETPPRQRTSPALRSESARLPRLPAPPARPDNAWQSRTDPRPAPKRRKA